MPRRYKERHYRRRRSDYDRQMSRFNSGLRRPRNQLLVLAGTALVIILLILRANQANSGNDTTTSLPAQISVSEAYAKYQTGAYLLDVRTQGEWNEFHAPNTTLIPLDQLPARLNEIPRDREIVVVCRSGNRSQQGRDILLDAGFTQVTSMQGGLTEWRASGYPVEP